MKTMNYFPFYNTLLSSKQMTTGFRLSDKTKLYEIGEKIKLTTGWNQDNMPKKNIGEIEITEIKYKQLNELTDEDFKGQSPECNNLERAILCLSAIYKKEVSAADKVTVIKWKFLAVQKQKHEPGRRLDAGSSRPKTNIL